MRMYLNFKNERRLNRYNNNNNKTHAKKIEQTNYYPGEKKLSVFQYNSNISIIIIAIEKRKSPQEKKASYLYVYIYNVKK